MRSLRSKILAVAALLVLVAQVGTVTAVLAIAKSDVADRASRTMNAGTEVIARFVGSRSEQLHNTVTALAADYGFKQAVGTRDSGTVESALLNHQRRAGAAISFLVDRNGELLAVGEHAAGLFDNPADSAAGDFRTAGRNVVARDGRAYEIITVPVKAPLPIAWLSMGFEIDDAFAAQLAKLVGLDVALVSIDSSGSEWIAASDPEFRSHDANTITVPSSIAEVGSFDDREFLIAAQPYLPGNSDINFLLFRSMADAMAPFSLLRTASLALALLPLGVALIGAALLSRALTQPIAQLKDAVNRMASGDYSATVDIRSGDELADFGNAFNAMQTEIEARESRITYQARHDAITGLYNASRATELLRQLVEASWDSNRTVGVLILRLNAFSELASTLGQELAQAFLVECARRLTRYSGPDQIVARLENDDFLLTIVEDEEFRIRDFADDLLAQLEKGIRLPSVNATVRPVIGMARFPKDAGDAESLLLRATIALEEAAAEGRRQRFYRIGDQEKNIRNLDLLQDLQRAADDNELKLYCQPKIALQNETVCGAESLVRWDHKNYGWLPPGEFIPLVERSGNISILTRWVLRESVRQLADWQSKGISLNLAVNLSAIDLQDEGLLWYLHDLLKVGNADPHNLTLEVTEEAMVKDFSRSSTTLRRLADLGVRLSVDDFGTGYSSLSQLKNLPVNELKIDRSFIADLPDDPTNVAIVSAIVDMGRKLGLSVVAEGVTDGAALRWLQAHDVATGQGFYWAEPMPAAQLETWLEHFSGGATCQTRVIELA